VLSKSLSNACQNTKSKALPAKGFLIMQLIYHPPEKPARSRPKPEPKPKPQPQKKKKKRPVRPDNSPTAKPRQRQAYRNAYAQAMTKMLQADGRGRSRKSKCKAAHKQVTLAQVNGSCHWLVKGEAEHIVLETDGLMRCQSVHPRKENTLCTHELAVYKLKATMAVAQIAAEFERRKGGPR
jgi:hypothetical protein